MLDRFRDFLSRATPAQRSIVAICAATPFLLAFLAALSVGLIKSSSNTLQALGFIKAATVGFALVLVAFAGMLLWLWPRRFSQQPMPNVFAAITLLATFCFTLTAMLGGNLTYPTNIFMIGIIPCGVLMLDIRSTLLGLILGVVMLCLNDLAIFTGLMQYAPAYSPQSFIGDQQIFIGELVRTGIQYASIGAYSFIIWFQFSHFDSHQTALKQLSKLDILTGLSNRRHFMERLETECRRFIRIQRSFCLVMIDADHFKKINDTHGHLVGDDVLKAIAQLLNQHMRVPADLAARIGGEEFALLLPDTDLAGAQVLCERIRSSLSRLSFQGAEYPFNVTLSMGVVENEGQNVESLLHFADANLYLAKARGRNQVVASRCQQESSRELADTVA